MKLVIKDKTYVIKFAYAPTLKQGILGKLKSISDSNEEDGLSGAEKILEFLPELLLVGLQKHNEVFRFDYNTNAGKEEQLEKVYDMIDDYCEEPDSDLMELYEQLQDSLLENSFLSALLRRGQKEVEKAEETAGKNSEN